MNILDNLPKPLFALAPMDDVTDLVFRQMVASTAAPDLFFTEFANVDGLQSPGRPRLLKKLRFAESETSLVAHIWGLQPENFYKTAREIADGTLARELGLPAGCNFVGIDLNMGCPAKSEVKAGACSALIKNRPLASEIIKATQAGAGGKLPVSVKTRLGFSEIDLTWPEFLLGHDLAMMTVHARTRKEMSKVPAHWEYFADVVKLRDKLAPATKIVGNGDIESRAHGLELAEKYNLDGIMIGRGIFHDPFAFAAVGTHSAQFEFFSSDARRRITNTTYSASRKENPNCTQVHDSSSPWLDFSKDQRIALYKKHVELFAKTWRDGERPIHTLNKFCKIYISDFDGAKEFREQLMAAQTVEALLHMLEH